MMNAWLGEGRETNYESKSAGGRAEYQPIIKQWNKFLQFCSYVLQMISLKSNEAKVLKTIVVTQQTVQTFLMYLVQLKHSIDENDTCEARGPFSKH